MGKIEKKQLNLPINKLTLEAFKTACDKHDLKMNWVLEQMMNLFIDDEFEIVNTRYGTTIQPKK
jgi:hypothetical protein